jgi:endonuclease G
MRSLENAVRRGALSRLAVTTEQQAYVEDAIRKGRPLDAEDDVRRKVAFIAKKLAVGTDVAARIAAYDDPRTLPLNPTQAAGAESLQGQTADFVGVHFLDLARAASRAVARVTRRDGRALGTGFLVAPDLFLTNHHVISDPAQLGALSVEFNFELDVNAGASRVTTFQLDSRFYVSCQTDDLDYALVRVASRMVGTGNLSDFGYLPLSTAEDKHMKAGFVNIIQHPDGRPKQLVIRENRIIARTDNTLLYGADTLPGSSGSPVCNDDFEVVALHHWGSPYRARREAGSARLPDTGNEGIRISSIAHDLARQLTTLGRGDRAVVGAALQLTTTRSPLARTTPSPGGLQHMSTDETRSIVPRVEADGAVTWSFPVEISVRLGASGGSTRDERQPVSDTRDTLAPEVGNRETPSAQPTAKLKTGYNPAFLGIRVPLPQLSDELAKDAAKTRNPRANANPHELKYHRFSVVMNGVRRIAFFTAVNIDGAAVVTISRKTGKLVRVEAEEEFGAERYESWYEDDRIDAQQQCTQKLYDDAALNDLQRGHLVKRTDPMWGTEDSARAAEADTFHFTNCAPQHEEFNPRARRWAGLENWITKRSDDENLRVSVFTGPIFRPRDPKRGYVRVPLQYWKVVVRVEEGDLRATAVVADQSGLMRGRSENLGPLPVLVETRQVRVDDLERVTGLSFGALSAHDTYDTDAETDRADSDDAETLSLGDAKTSAAWVDFRATRTLRENLRDSAERVGASESLRSAATYKITVTTPADRPRFFFYDDDEVDLDLTAPDTRSGTESRTFADATIPFKLRIFEPSGTAYTLVIEQDDKEVHKKVGTTDRPNFSYTASFQRVPSA